jgi:hypothetical protein
MTMHTLRTLAMVSTVAITTVAIVTNSDTPQAYASIGSQTGPSPTAWQCSTVWDDAYNNCTITCVCASSGQEEEFHEITDKDTCMGFASPNTSYSSTLGPCASVKAQR